MATKFKTSANATPSKGSEMNPETLTEQSGAVPTHIKVKNYQMAGINLDKARREQYDLYKDDPDYDDKLREIVVPVTRKAGVTLDEIMDEENRLIKKKRDFDRDQAKKLSEKYKQQIIDEHEASKNETPEETPEETENTQ